MSLFVVLLLSVFVLQLMRYQLAEGASYRSQSEKTTLSMEPITATRGEILDRYGRRLATSRVGYTAVFDWAYFPHKSAAQENTLILKLAKLLREDKETWTDSLPISAAKPYAYQDSSSSDVSRLKKMLKTDGLTADPASIDAPTALALLENGYKIDAALSDDDKRLIAGVRYEMEQHAFSVNNNIYTFATDISIQTVSKISERSLDLPGVEIDQDPIRVYPNGTIAPHVIGLTGPIYAEQYASLVKQKLGYSMDDTIGKSGLESTMEQYLRGIDGTKGIELNSKGRVVSSSVTQQPRPGDTVVTTIDSKLQQVVQNSLQTVIQNIVAASGGDPEYGANAKSGAAVVIDIKTGQVLAMASYPSYDLNVYKSQYSQLAKQTGSPLLDRCVAGVYRPGSTYKPVVATAALMSGAITANTEFFCDEELTRYGHTFHCDGWHGWNNVVSALSVSCNVFFYNTGDLTGIKKIDATASALGLGKKTGIELPGEKSGILAGPDERAESGGQWYAGDVLQASIGQSDNLFSPLQLANYVATILNDGKHYPVHVVQKVVSYDNSKVIVDNDNPKPDSNLKIPQWVMDTVKTGMGEVTGDDGTASNAFDNFPIKTGGKTGTAQVNGGYNGVYVGFAPYDNPQIAVAAVVEHGYHGNQVAPLARDVFNAYFFSSNNVSSPQNTNAIQP